MSLVRDIAYTIDGKYICSVCDFLGEHILFWNVEKKELKYERYGHEDGAICVAYSPDGKYMVTGSKDKTILTWFAEYNCGDNIGEGHEGEVTCLDFSPDSQFIVSGASDKNVIIWDTTTAYYVKILEGHEYAITSVKYSPDGKYIASASFEGELILWEAESGKIINRINSTKNRITCIKNSPYSTTEIYIGMQSGEYYIWDIPQSKIIRTYFGRSNKIYDIGFFPNRVHFAVCSAESIIKIRDIQTGEIIKELHGGDKFTYKITFSSDGKYFATGWGNGNITIWNQQSLNKVVTIKAHSFRIASIRFNLKGDVLISCSNDNYIRFWKPSTGLKISEIFYEGKIYSSFTSMDLSPDGNTLALGTTDGLIYLYNIRTQSKIVTSKGHISEVNCITYSANGEFIATGSIDNTIIIWSKDGEQLYGPLIHISSVESIQFNQSVTKLISADASRFLCIWDLEKWLLV